jgi:hypothetical protein
VKAARLEDLFGGGEQMGSRQLPASLGSEGLEHVHATCLGVLDTDSIQDTISICHLGAGGVHGP